MIAKIDGSYFTEKDISQLLNNNHIKELDINLYDLKLKLNDFTYQSIRRLKIDSDKFMQLKKFKNLEILEATITLGMLKNFITHLASKFSPDHFKRLQINLFFSNFQQFQTWYDNLDEK